MQAAEVLVELLLIFASARVAGELMLRLGQPAVVGELLVGVIFGPHALGLLKEGEVVSALAEIGVVFLLFEVGLENRVSDIRKVGGTATGVALAGVAAPMAAGFGLGRALGYQIGASLFLGAAMVATSVGVTARVLSELGRLRERSSRVILGAAVVDDVLGLLILAVVAGITRGGLKASSLIILLVEVAAFIGLIATIGPKLIQHHAPRLEGLRLHDGPFVFAVVICLGLSALAGLIGLAAIVGAFLAGMILAETKEQFALEKSVEPVTNFLTPFFFVATGMAVEPAALRSGGALVALAAVTVVAVVTKFVPCMLAARGLGRDHSRQVGMGMVPRGEVGVIVAAIGLRSEVITESVYAVVVGMAILTTLIAPPIVRMLFRKHPVA